MLIFHLKKLEKEIKHKVRNLKVIKVKAKIYELENEQIVKSIKPKVVLLKWSITLTKL